MKKVRIGLFKGSPPLLALSLHDYEGTEELCELVLVIERTLKNNFPGIQVKRNKAIRERCQEEPKQP